MAFRCDVAELGMVERTPAGGLRVPAVVARSTVLAYPWGREYVPPEVLASSLPQLRGLPLSLGHPPEKRVDSDNWATRSAGHAGEDARLEGGAQEVTLYVQRADAVRAVERGTHRQISMGYDVELDQAPGTAPDGQRYDAKQVSRTYNHIALVRNARGGSTLAVRLDSSGDAEIEDPASAGGEEIATMRKRIRLDGIDHEVEAPESYFQALDQADQRRAGELTAEKARADAATGERDQLKAQLAAEKARADAAESPARLDERVKARTELEARARKVLGDKAELSGKTDRQVMELAIRADAAEDLSKLSDDYVRGAFNARTSMPGPHREDSLDGLRRTLGGQRPEEERPSPLTAAIQRLRQDQAEAASRPLGGAR